MTVRQASLLPFYGVVVSHHGPKDLLVEDEVLEESELESEDPGNYVWPV